MVHRIGEFFLAVESVYQKYAAAAVQRSGHPDRHGKADSQVHEVAVNDKHFRFLLSRFERVQ
jgi:hypothetical protein